MKIKILIIFSLLSFKVYCQIGIGIKNFNGIFYIDAKQNSLNLNDNILNDEDDFIFTFNGLMGIGTSISDHKLTIVGNKTNYPLNILNIKKLQDQNIIYNVGIDVDFNIGIVNNNKSPTVFFYLLNETKGLDIGNSNSTINLPIGNSQVKFNTASISFGTENNINFLEIPSDGIYAIEAVGNFYCDTTKIWGVNLIIRKKEISQQDYIIIDSRRIVTKLGNESNTNNNIPLPGHYFGIFSFKKNDKVSIDLGTGFVATSVKPETCGTSKPYLNSSATNFIIKKIN